MGCRYNVLVTGAVIDDTVNLPGPRLSRLFGLQIVLTG